jgi:hypothetical protein
MSLPVPDFSREPPWDPKPGPALKSTTIDEKINAMTLRNRPTSNRHRPTPPNFALFHLGTRRSSRRNELPVFRIAMTIQFIS